MKCAVSLCQNTYYKTKKASGHNEVSFFSFPKDLSLRKVWVNKCKRADKVYPEKECICSDHFEEDDFERDLQAELMGLKPKRILKPNVIPRRKFNAGSNEEATMKSDREKRMETKQQKKMISNLLCESEAGNICRNEENVSLKSENEIIMIDSDKFDYLTIKKENEELRGIKRKYDELLENFKKNDDVMVELKKQKLINSAQAAELKKLTTETAMLKKEIDYLKSDKYLVPLIKSKLYPTLTSNQIDLIFKKKKQVRWDNEEVKRAIAIRYLNKKCYIYMRKFMSYPMPAISTIYEKTSTMDMREGILEEMFSYLEIASTSFKEKEKLVVIQFDEVKVCGIYEYDQQHDEVVGPHKYLQIILARGLFSDWQQPLCILFDQKVTKSIIDEVVEKLFRIGFTTVGCVSDCGGGNVSLWKELEVTYDKPYYFNNALKGRIYFFADAPHLLKLIRNWLIDVGFKLDDGTVITKDPIKTLLNLSNTEVSSVYQLTEKHITLMKTERQNVNMAAQLLSHSTATGLRRYLPDDKLANDVADFIDGINVWFDIMNSYSLNATQDQKRPYGVRLQEQKTALTETYDMMKNMRCLNKESLQIFQEGVLMSINSLIGLYEDLNLKYGIEFILTHKINLENTFSQIRIKGGLDDHPSPLNALARLRMIVLGKNQGVVQDKLNEEDKSLPEFVTARVLKQAAVSKKKVGKTANKSSLDKKSHALSSAASEDMELENVVEADGRECVASWIAKKFKEKYPQLGAYTHKTRGDHDYGNQSNTNQLSWMEEWIEKSNLIEKYFEKYHPPNNFQRENNVVKQLSQKIFKKMKNLPYEVIYAYIRQRTFIRIKHLNLQLKLQDFIIKEEK